MSIERRVPVTAVLSHAVEASAPSGQDPERHIPLHTLQGEQRVWADRLLRIFRGRQIDGVEWSLKFSAAGLVGNRFLLGVQRENWQRIDWAGLPRALAIPQRLWSRIVEDMEQARAALFAYEPGEGTGVEGAGTYRIYLERMPMPEALRQHGVLPLGCGYKWNPATEHEAAVTAYRIRHCKDRAAFECHLQPYLDALRNPVARRVAEDLIGEAARQADPAGFMFLEAQEAQTRRESFTVTFRGTDLPLRQRVPDLLLLAESFALPAAQVLDALLPDDPRSLYSLGAGCARDGNEFMTFYYD